MEKVKVKIHCNHEGKDGCFVTDKNDKPLTPIFDSAYDLFMSDEYKSLEITYHSNYATTKAS